MGCAGQPACSSCFILSAVENQITWNKALVVSHCGTSERTWPWEWSACCWVAACGQAPPGAEAQIHPPEVTVPCKMSEGTSLKETSSGSPRCPHSVTSFPWGTGPHSLCQMLCEPPRAHAVAHPWDCPCGTVCTAAVLLPWPGAAGRGDECLRCCLQLLKYERVGKTGIELQLSSIKKMFIFENTYLLLTSSENHPSKPVSKTKC